MLGIRTADRLCRSSFKPMYRTMAKVSSSITPATASAEKDIETLVATKIDPKLLETQGKFPGMPRHRVKYLDKVCLVWSGHYKTFADVPPTVDYEEIHKSKTYARVRVNVGALFIGAMGCVLMVILGKNAAKAGISIEAENLKWHREINEEHRLQEEEGSKK